MAQHTVIDMSCLAESVGDTTNQETVALPETPHIPIPLSQRVLTFFKVLTRPPSPDETIVMIA
jgi:hypothetical protein